MSNPFWREHAACRGVDTELFFDPFDVETGKLVNEAALNEARKTCHDCPVRKACLSDISTYELGLETVNRSGLVAYLSPGQRESAEKRGTLRCPRCDSVRDPVLIERGVLRCPRNCGEKARRIPAIPHDGDQWTKRHTTLSQRIVGWVLDNTSMGDILPTPTRMAELLGGVRRSDVLRVYAAMTADGTIARDDHTYTRVGATGVLRKWYPSFLTTQPAT